MGSDTVRTRSGSVSDDGLGEDDLDSLVSERPAARRVPWWADPARRAAAQYRMVPDTTDDKLCHRG